MQFTAKVIAGEGRGKRLGFPTANLDKKNLNIEHGVYSADVEIDNKFYKGLLHFGPKKTFNEDVSLELYIKNFDFDIYHKDVKIKIIKKIREIRKFNGAEELKKQICRDLKKYA
ncbi:riboflavin kinase [Patescibacteria group bacterium]|nr:riboflavin kinase [Patescibacteria group bacterium]MBU4455383.1 riboflavin kinase [Patescibacteria group bacterium]MCG2690741.1 riboflavin kinase [Candidatus Parcubacteria bacterium]